MIKYPYSNLTKPHPLYMKLVAKFFSTLYNVYFHVSYNDTSIIIRIFDVNPNKFYNPMNFDPYFKVMGQNNEIVEITKQEIFSCFYMYLPDIVPYLEFELYAKKR